MAKLREFYEQPNSNVCTLIRCRTSEVGCLKNGFSLMASFKDPDQCFAPLEVIERLLQIRQELGFAETIYLDRSGELTDFLDAYGFDIYAFETGNEKINYNDYRTPVVPGGDFVHCSLTAH